MSELLSSLSTAVINGNKDDFVELTQQALDAGLSAQEILNDGLMPGMNHVGAEFRSGKMFVPEVLRSARAMQRSMDILKPLLAESGIDVAGKILLGTVKGDLHDIGKNLVGMMCEGAGFEVRDLGKDVEPEGFVEAVKEFEPNVLGMSALLTTGGSRYSRKGQSDGWRGTGDSRLCRSDWGRRLRVKCRRRR
jgi:5-methyltetrahydrofolate--homocysteine methyltransferase